MDNLGIFKEGLESHMDETSMRDPAALGDAAGGA